MNLYANGGKRAFDVLSACALLLIASPLLAIISLVLVTAEGRPLIFAQQRAGRGGKPFTVLKFRTMRDAKPGVRKSERVTPIGRILRQTSLDELPQLVNVLLGDMGIVGPRPLHMSYISRYTTEHSLRLNVRPGLTGLVQVSGRNSLTWEQKFDLDVHYVDNLSLLGDLTILVRTVGVVARPQHGAASTEPSTEYLGSDPKESE